MAADQSRRRPIVEASADCLQIKQIRGNYIHKIFRASSVPRYHRTAFLRSFDTIKRKWIWIESHCGRRYYETSRKIFEGDHGTYITQLEQVGETRREKKRR